MRVPKLLFLLHSVSGQIDKSVSALAEHGQHSQQSRGGNSKEDMDFEHIQNGVAASVEAYLRTISLPDSKGENRVERSADGRNLKERGGLFPSPGKDGHRKPLGGEGERSPLDSDQPGTPPQPCVIMPEELRFSKVFFPPEVDDDQYSTLLPLSNRSFPVSGIVAEMLKKDSLCHSVVTQDTDHEVYYDVEDLIQKVGGLPSFPSQTENVFWEKLKKVMDVQVRRRAGDLARDIIPVPDAWENFTMEEAAEAVHDEYPGLHQSLLLNSFISSTKYGKLVVDDKIIPKRSRGRFLSKHVMLADMNTWSIGFVGPHNFGAKWFAGRPRPEEVVWAINNGSVSEGVPRMLRNRAIDLRISKAEDFTAYDEGCPPHPSWPAMHSAASQASFWLSVVLDISPAQLCEARKTDYAVAYARTLAGVHYEDDNIAGLMMGQEILSMKLAEHLATKYGSDPAAVQVKINSSRFNWARFDPNDPCPKDGASN